MDNVYAATAAKIQSLSETATSARTAVKVGHREFFYREGQLHVLAWFGRSAYAAPCTLDQAVSLARNHAHVKAKTCGQRGHRTLEIVMGSGG